jgi:hypothetical protein
MDLQDVQELTNFFERRVSLIRPRSKARLVLGKISRRV